MKRLKVKLSERQREGMFRNYGGMSVKTRGTYAPEIKSVIIMMAVIVPTIKGKLGLTMLTNDGAFLVTAKGIFTALTTNTGGFFTPAFANLALIDTQARAFEDAIDDLELGMLGAEGAKTEAKKALKITLDAALAYVNNLAYLDQPHAVEIITGANMLVISRAGINKQDFAVRQGDASGEVKLTSRAAKFNGKRVKAYYEWQYSINDGATWISLDTTVVAKTVAVDMAVDVKTLFRKRSSTVKGGTSAWCAPLAITPV